MQDTCQEDIVHDLLVFGDENVPKLARTDTTHTFIRVHSSCVSYLATQHALIKG